MAAAKPCPDERGFVMILALVALAIMLVGATAMFRSTDATQLSATNLALKRDLVNQGELGILRARALLDGSAALASEAARQKHLKTSNYSATQLPSDEHGIPTALMRDADFATYGDSANDIVDATTKVSIRYLIDRLCGATGEATAANCTLGASSAAVPGGSENTVDFDLPGPPVYRISVRARGPRQSETFLQATLSR